LVTENPDQTHGITLKHPLNCESKEWLVSQKGGERMTLC
jgi:hypothetical protein